MSEHHTPGSADSPHDQHVVEKLGYEARDILGSRRSIFYYAAMHFGLVVLTGVVVFVIYWIIARNSPGFDPQRQGGASSSEAAKLQKDPGPDMKAYRQSADEKLNGYGWVDESRGLVHVPIEKAIEITAAQGLSHRPEGSQ